MSTLPDWRLADPASIAQSLERARSLPSGGWFVVDATRRIRAGRASRYDVDGHEFVLWRDGAGSVLCAPAACPHLGADLSTGKVTRGRLVCPWHGLTLGARGHGEWQCHRVHDDGVLIWVQPDPGAPGATDAPILAPRPTVGIDAVIRREAQCEPADVIANRLDPWHGAHFHPYAFQSLQVTEDNGDRIALDVTYAIAGRLRVPVSATFHCPEPNTIVMTITAGEGTGSVVETHATPMWAAAAGRPPRTAIVEATIAASDRPGFVRALSVAPAIRPVIRLMAKRLWRDDARYAERTYAVRARGSRTKQQ